MVYEKQDWQNGEGGGTPITAARLRHMETQYETLVDDLLDPQSVPGAALSATIGAAVADDGARLFARRSVNLGGYVPGRTTPRFVRANGGAPIFSQAAQNPAPGTPAPATQATIYYPAVLDARATFGADALDEWYMYLSTDHDDTQGGIWLYTAPTQYGPWTGRGRVFFDAVLGSQTETPSVIVSPQTGLVHMYYQNAGVPGRVGQQSTCLATSVDGRTWTRVGPILDVRANATNGDGHTGYFRPQLIGAGWVGYSLYGGGNYPHFALWRSADGIEWFADPNPLSNGDDLFEDGRRIEWNTIEIVWWQGRLWAVGACSDYSSGGAAKDARLFVAPLADDLRHIIGKPIYQLAPAQGLENTNYRSNRTVVDREGNLVLYYQSSSADLTASYIFAAVAA